MEQNHKRERFRRIAEARTNKVLDMLRLLGNCANRAAYEYDESEIKRIFSAIDAELKAARTKFHDKKSEKFKLD